MNARELLFLLRKGLIDPTLLGSVEKRGKGKGGRGPSLLIKDKLEERDGTALAVEVMLIGMFVAGTILFGVWVGNESGKSLMALFMLCSIPIILILRWMTLNMGPEVKRLSKLNTLVAEERPDIPYCLNLTSVQLGVIADDILDRLGRKLRVEEGAHGVDDPITNSARTRFNNAHSIFVDCSLCEENQKEWLPEQVLSAQAAPA